MDVTRACLLVATIGAAAGSPVLSEVKTRASVEASAQVLRPEARVETEPMSQQGDAADDPAVWIHPSDPALSLIIGTNKQGGLYSYNIDGTQHQVVAEHARPNNVDVLEGFELGGRRVDLAVASVRGSKKAKGLKVWAIDADTRSLSDVTDGGIIRAFQGDEPYGACGYRSLNSGVFYVFVTDPDGRVEQIELTEAGSGKVAGGRVRTLEVGSTAEGCVADDDLGFVYISEEKRGIWKFGAEPDAGRKGKLTAKVGEHGLTAHVEGLAIYEAAQGRGYLIASSQGSNSFNIYGRGGDNSYVATIDPRDGRIDDVAETDGIAVTSCPTSAQFGKGMLVVHDGQNAGGNQNFKLFAWEDVVAGSDLLVDPRCRTRAAAR